MNKERDDRRQAVIKIIEAILDEKGDLTTQLALLSHPKKAFIQATSYGLCRHFHYLFWLTSQLLKKPFKPKDRRLQLILMLGLYELAFQSTPEHAVVNACVELTQFYRYQWASGLINACLRNYLRRKNQFVGLEPQVQFSHPEWLVTQLQKDYPQDWPIILEANNAHPPMFIRVNQQKISTQDYLDKLTERGIDAAMPSSNSCAIKLIRPLSVEMLPGFSDGLVSVQDLHAQYSAEFLTLKPNLRVLDACAAPGGKTCHLLELEPTLSLLALDKHAGRALKIKENLIRLHCQAEVQCADATNPSSWWDGKYFDRILLDAPCSAIGVIRRHPDIKLLRTPQDIQLMVELQKTLLDSLWSLLKPGGMMLYATCSLLKAENENQVSEFMQRHKGRAQLATLPTKPGAIQLSHGMQFLPSDGDGFYYAKIIKPEV